MNVEIGAEAAIAVAVQVWEEPSGSLVYEYGCRLRQQCRTWSSVLSTAKYDMHKIDMQYLGVQSVNMAAVSINNTVGIWSSALFTAKYYMH